VANITEVVPAADWAGRVKRSKSEVLHDTFRFGCNSRRLPVPRSSHHADGELLFALASHDRRWRFDFARQCFLVAVELEGLVMRTLHEFDARQRRYKPVTVVMGRHATPAGIKEDMTKYNVAAEIGWYVLRFEQGAVKSGEAVDQTVRVLHARGWRP
jgi:hypothetical protein